MKTGYFKIVGDKNCYAMIDGEKYSFKEYKEFVRQILYMMIIDGEALVYPLHDGIITPQKIEHAIRSHAARILRAAGWKTAE